MIVLDTHIWVWWVHRDPNLTSRQIEWLQQHEAQDLGVSAITCWEVAKLVEYGRLKLPLSVGDWMEQAFAYPGMRLLPLSPEVAVEATRLPGLFHRDPADQIIVATARIYRCPLLTSDKKLLSYAHVDLLK
jgi:PIN domain nuclease of toxin-antitoxin system